MMGSRGSKTPGGINDLGGVVLALSVQKLTEVHSPCAGLSDDRYEQTDLTNGASGGWLKGRCWRVVPMT